LIARFGSDIQKQVYLPKICQAQAFFCIGMSEPQAGSDLASIRARATPSGDGWRLSGQKIWTTNAHRSHYMIALVRTSGTAEDRHKGLSQFVIDLKAPGVTVRSIRDLAGDAHFNEVFFDQVELDAQALIGAEGAGWAQVNAELAFERSGPERIYSSMVLLDTWLAHIHARPDASTREHNVVLIGRILAQLAVLRAMSIGTTARLAAGESPLVESALMKDLGTQFEQDLAQWIADAISADDDFVDSELIETLAYTQQISPSFSLRGGTREILRGMIARGLGLR
jgi:alkylation response protein AidB-like acyl-CoA dehydrogenase